MFFLALWLGRTTVHLVRCRNELMKDCQRVPYPATPSMYLDEECVNAFGKIVAAGVPLLVSPAAHTVQYSMQAEGMYRYY